MYTSRNWFSYNWIFYFCGIIKTYTSSMSLVSSDRWSLWLSTISCHFLRLVFFLTFFLNLGLQAIFKNSLGTLCTVFLSHSCIQYICEWNFPGPPFIIMSTIHPSLEYCCFIWRAAPDIYLGRLDKMPRNICTIIGPDLSAQHQSLSQRLKVASLCFFFNFL